jgi:GNAT superfamily N-acetyltransferase
MITLCTTLDGVDWEALRLDLIADGFHNGRSTRQLRLSFENSTHVAMGFDGARCIANARMLSDGVGNAYVLDVWTHSAWRRRGIARRAMQLLLDAVPGQHVYLGTDDAAGFYAKLGFAPQMQGMSLIVGNYLDNATRRDEPPPG